MRKELCAIRDKVNVLIDAIDRVPKTSSHPNTAPGGGGQRGGASESHNVPQQNQLPPQTAVKGEGVYAVECEERENI